MREKCIKVVLRGLGMLLLTAAVLLLTAAIFKGHKLLTVSVANTNNAVTVKSPALSLNEPKLVTSRYEVEVLDPQTWVDEELPIIDHIDIGQQLKTGNWLIMLYYYDCSDCAEVIPKIEQMAKDMQGNEDVLKFALIELPPYRPVDDGSLNKNSPCVTGKLDVTKEWLVETPAFILLSNFTTIKTWKENIPVFEELIEYLSKSKKHVTQLD